MADIEEIEFAIIPPGESRAVDWMNDKAAAIAEAEARGEGWKVQEIVTYCRDRDIVHTVGLSGDDETEEG